MKSLREQIAKTLEMFYTNYIDHEVALNQILQAVKERDDYIRGVGEVREVDMDKVDEEIGYSSALEFVRKRQEETL